MNMPKDTKGGASEDVEAHARAARDTQGEEPARLRDTSDDVEAHGRYYDAGEEEDVEGHGAQRPRPDTDAEDEEDVEAHRRHFFK